MSGISSIAGLSGLSDTDLYYQYLINNNSKSTMFNALNGNDTDNSTNALGSLGTLSSLGSLTGIGSSSTMQSFASVLQSYMNSQQSQAASMADTLSGIMKQAESEGDTSSISYQTVQSLYDYFKNASGTSSSELLKTLYGGSTEKSGSTSSGAASASAQNTSDAQSEVQFGEFDFDKLEQQLDDSMASSMKYTGI